MEIELAVSQTAKKHGYSPLKDEQRMCIEEFLKGRDVVVVLLTGFGKTACYVCLPSVFDFYLNRLGSSTSIVVVVSPLIALMKDQVDTSLNVAYLLGIWIPTHHMK